MAKEVIVPPLGQTTDEVRLVTWYKKEGEEVKEGEPLFAIETDKATLDVEAQASGVLRRVTASEGQTLKALSTIALIAEPGEEVAEGRRHDVPSPPSRDTLRPVVSRRRTSAPLYISPRARRLAEAKGVALEGLSGTGPEGAIVERDVRAYIERRAEVQLHPFNEVLAEAPLQGIRATIAERMSRSASTTARVTLTAEVDASGLVELRRKLAEDGIAVSYNDLFLYVLGRALRENPLLNASLEGDVLRQWKRIHIGLAVDTERGLLVPVVRDVDTKGLAQLARETMDLIERARGGKLKPEELRGGTFTLTNLGMFGIDAFTPIINLPETAILGVGRIGARPCVRDGDIVIREMVWLSLAFDHRLVDGGPAARFLQRVAQLIESPHLMHA
ncbi:MAG: dihydrolipoamide acetyltransferase family protein [bacterium]